MDKLLLFFIQSLDSQYNPQSEPTITQIQNHIRQLAPILNKYNGVVVAVQAGFHGEYGKLSIVQYKNHADIFIAQFKSGYIFTFLFLYNQAIISFLLQGWKFA